MSSENNKRIAKNTAMLYFRMLFTMAVSLYTSRVILNTLGVEDFGIYNVVGGVVVMLGFLNNAMTASTQRFLTFEIGRKNYISLKQVFSISITIHALLAMLVLLLGETIGIWFINSQLNIPTQRLDAAIWVYQFAVLSFILNIISVPYVALITAHERMKAFAYISILEVVLKLVIVFILRWFEFDKLSLFGLLTFLVVFVIRAFYYIYCKYNFTESKFIFYWNKSLFYKMSSFANWNLFGVFAGIAYNQGVNILLNIFFGPIINSARGIAFQVQGAINSFVTNFQMAVNPPITKTYATGDKEYMYTLVLRSAKYSFFLLYIISLPILLQTDYILNLWLKNVPEYTSIFTKLVLIDILVCSLSGSLQTLVQATGKVKVYQIVVSGILLLNLPISYILLSNNFSPQSTFILSISLSILALIGRLIILKNMMNFPIKLFIKDIILKVLIISSISLILPYYISVQQIQESLVFILVCLASIISGISTIYFLGISDSEKIFIKQTLLKRH